MRKLIVPGALLLLLLAVGALKLTQIATLIRGAKAAKREGPPPVTVVTAFTAAARWESTLPAVGSVAAVRGVTISSELPGKVESIAFKSGARVEAGALLVQLDVAVERGQLAAAKSQMDLAEATVKRSRVLARSQAISEMQLDADEAAFKSAQANHQALRAAMGRKVVRAPFAGRLGIRQVNLGQYLQPGTPIVVIESLGAVFVDFSLPQQRLDDIRVGMPVRVHLPAGEELVGQVAVLDPGIEAATRSMKLRASVPDDHDLLRPGMFVQVEVVLAERTAVVAAPVTAVIHAPYGDSVFLIEDQGDTAGAPMRDAEGRPRKVVRQQFVRVGAHRGDFVAFEAGLQPGQELVTEGGFKLHNGDRVLVDNRVQRVPALSPHLENR